MNNQFKSIFITPNNVRDLASTLHENTVIQARAIQFGPVSAEGTTLLEVPILSPGEAGPQTTIRITVGLDAAASISGTDHDPDVGITDGVNHNRFRLHDIANLGSYSQCYAVDARAEHPPGSSGPGPDKFTLIFTPYHKYGTCYSAQDSGYVSVATFNNQLDATKGISFRVSSQNAHEKHRFYFFMIEVFEE